MRIAGVDEAGRGPLAGPVVAAAVVFPPGYSNIQINDSKKLNAKKRTELFSEIQSVCDWVIIAVGHRRIDKLNIRNATKLAMSLAVRRINADLVQIDGNMSIDTDLPQETIIKGDALIPVISAASILAKVWRDSLMRKIADKYKGYGFEIHAGYPTKFHRDAIRQLGPCVIHRQTFRGVKEYLNPEISDTNYPLLAVGQE